MRWRRSGRRPPVEFLIPGGFVLVVVTCAVAALALPEGTVRVITMAAAVGAFALWAGNPAAALATAATAWFFTTGFLVNGAGELTFSRDDVIRLGAFVATGLAGLGCDRLRQVHGSRRRARRLMRARADPRRRPVLSARRRSSGVRSSG
ncbi:hypothetical protein IMZ11_08305 [Microtetraspora sp. AC03309]|uniref:hypothetical protein n=1 Tax=Microtetraspora sp. AC03309 TaxID=2779376 RepID=UPI001E59E3A1|nr:hypothetical protein [Microtetraspora sp. AC03309]MCC5575643.1 hypothetical protein [Microtetraspora sp. AC03309]